MASGEITHIEFPADDVERAKRFYSAVELLTPPADVLGIGRWAAVLDSEGSELGLWEVAAS